VARAPHRTMRVQILAIVAGTLSGLKAPALTPISNRDARLVGKHVARNLAIAFVVVLAIPLRRRRVPACLQTRGSFDRAYSGDAHRGVAGVSAPLSMNSGGAYSASVDDAITAAAISFL
jgi:hypothetical protein